MGQARHGCATVAHAIRAAMMRPRPPLVRGPDGQVERMDLTIREDEADQKRSGGSVSR